MVTSVVLAVPGDPYLALPAAATYCSLSERTLRAHIASLVHPLPHFKVGSRVVIKRSDLDSWMSRHRRVGRDLEARIEQLRAKERRHVGVDLESRIARLQAREKRRKRTAMPRGAVPHSISAR